MEVDMGSRKMFKVATQTIKDGKDVFGKGCIRDEMGLYRVIMKELCCGVEKAYKKKRIKKLSSEETEN